LVKQSRVKIKQLSGKSRVLALSQFNAAPLEDNVDWHDQVLGLLCDHGIEAGDDLPVLLEVGGEHLLHEFNSENGLAIVLHFVSLLGLHLVMEPLDTHVFLGTFLFVAWVYDEELFGVDLR